MDSIIQTWSQDVTTYALSERYELRRANPERWSIYYSVYYNQAYNGFFKEYKYDVYEGNDSYWIYKEDSRIGGVILALDRMHDLFFIPPFNDELVVVKLLKKLLVDFSDGSNDILVTNVLPYQIDLFARAGFWVGADRSRWMQRPTEVFEFKWDDCFRIATPKLEGERLVEEDEIAELFYDSFKGGVNAARRNHSSKKSFIFNRDASTIFTNKMLNASTLVYDNNTNQLVAACLVFMEDQQRTFFPGIFNIGVLPKYRNRGLASNMLKRALTVLHDDYPILRLGLLQGTYAESVYYDLGFMPADVEVEALILPTSEIKILKKTQ